MERVICKGARPWSVENNTEQCNHATSLSAIMAWGPQREAAQTSSKYRNVVGDEDLDSAVLESEIEALKVVLVALEVLFKVWKVADHVM